MFVVLSLGAHCFLLDRLVELIYYLQKRNKYTECEGLIIYTENYEIRVFGDEFWCVSVCTLCMYAKEKTVKSVLYF